VSNPALIRRNLLDDVNLSMTPLRLSIGYYILGIAILSIFTSRVCQECSAMQNWEIMAMFAISFTVVALLKALVEPYLLQHTPLLDNVRAQLVFDLLLYTMAGGSIAWHLTFNLEMAPDNGIKILIGCLSIGAFASLDNALCRERHIILSQSEREPDAFHFVPTSRRLFTAASFIVAFTCLLMALIFFNEIDYILEHKENYSSDVIKETVLFNTAFIITIILLLSLQVIRSYSGNLKLLFDSQLETLNAIEAGDYEKPVPVVTQDEFSLIAQKTNQMISGLKRAQAEENDFFDMSVTVSREVNLYPLLTKITNVCKRFLDTDRCTLFMYDHKADELWCMVGEGIDDRDIRFSARQGIAGHVFQSKKTLNIDDAYQDDRFNQAIDKLTGYHTKTVLSMPVLDKEGNCLGVIQAVNKNNGLFSARDEKRLGLFSGQAAIAISNARLFEDINAMKNYNESILKSLNDGVITFNEDEVLVKVNDAALNITGYQDGIEGHHAEDLFKNHNAWILNDLNQMITEEHEVNSLDADFVQNDGESTSINMNTVPLYDLEDKRIGSMLIIEDITKEKRMRSTMSRYMTEEVAERLLQNDENVLGGTDQFVSVLFSDIRGFTTLSESLGATETVTILNEYFSYMAEAVFQHDGILDKYIGDAIMAVFGAPFKTQYDADNSVMTAIDMMRALNKFNHSQIDRGVQPLEIGIGISTGDVVSGNIGSPRRMDYTVVGDTVNLASRLEGTTKFYSCPIVICAETRNELQDDYLIREVDSIRVKGKDLPIDIFEVMDFHTRDSFPHLHELLDIYQNAINAYKHRDWQQALSLFQDCHKIRSNDGPTKIYLQRCEYFQQHPPTASWDGVWTMESK